MHNDDYKIWSWNCKNSADVIINPKNIDYQSQIYED
jgi:hypothetical protein